MRKGQRAHAHKIMSLSARVLSVTFAQKFTTMITSLSAIQLLDIASGMQEWAGYLVTAIASGSISWVTTVKWTRQQAKSDAMKSVQDVYQELMEDLKKDRDAQREENERLTAKIQEYGKRFDELERKCKENERRYLEQEKRLRAMRPLLCSVVSCPNRKSEITITEK